jgi:single-stranded DNA-specific DHH superfamily exonuclease
MSSDQKIELLKSQAKKAVKLVDEYDFIRIYTHHDPDGISAGAIIAKSLLRVGKRFHITFLKGLNESFEYGEDELLLFADMGSGYPDIISEVNADVVVLDHHIPLGEIHPKKRFAHVNPHLAGFDGTYELSASGVAYFFANELGNNGDLSSLAVVGMIGDKQKIEGANAEIIRQGEMRGYIQIKPGINLHSGRLRDVLYYSIDPYLDFFGKEKELEDFLSKLGLDADRNVDELNLNEMQKLADGITIRLLRNGAYEGVIQQVIGRRIFLANSLIPNATMLTDVVNACGREGAMSTAFSLLLGDENCLDEAMKISMEYTKRILEELAKRRGEVKEGFCIRYLVMEDAPSASPIATTFSRYLFSDRPLIVVNIKNGKAKVSARTTEKIAKVVNLAEVMRVAAEKVGGRGGGHRVAAGANITPEVVSEFLKEVDRLCCAMLA